MKTMILDSLSFNEEMLVISSKYIHELKQLAQKGSLRQFSSFFQATLMLFSSPEENRIGLRSSLLDWPTWCLERCICCLV